MPDTLFRDQAKPFLYWCYGDASRPARMLQQSMSHLPVAETMEPGEDADEVLMSMAGSTHPVRFSSTMQLLPVAEVMEPDEDADEDEPGDLDGEPPDWETEDDD